MASSRIEIHLPIGYVDLSPVGPAVLGAAVFAVGLALSVRTVRGVEPA